VKTLANITAQIQHNLSRNSANIIAQPIQL
jgi:hypothetical protein